MHSLADGKIATTASGALYCAAYVCGDVGRPNFRTMKQISDVTSAAWVSASACTAAACVQRHTIRHVLMHFAEDDHPQTSEGDGSAPRAGTCSHVQSLRDKLLWLSYHRVAAAPPDVWQPCPHKATRRARRSPGG